MYSIHFSLGLTGSYRFFGFTFLRYFSEQPYPVFTYQAFVILFVVAPSWLPLYTQPD